MEELPLDRYAGIRADLKAWAFGIARHGWPFFISVICGSAGTVFQYLGGSMTVVLAWTVAMGSFLVAAFWGWCDERRVKEKAMQPIEGIWTRKVFNNSLGIATLAFDGKTLSGTLKEGDIDHDIKGAYNATKRQFDATVERTHRLAVEQRKQQEVTFWTIGNDTLLYYTPDNGSGEVEQGTYKRKDTQPLWSAWMARHAPTAGKPQVISFFREE